jgi:cell division transport system permease protein
MARRERLRRSRLESRPQPSTRPGGAARRSGPGLLRRIRGYFRQHAQNSVGSLGRLARQPIASLLTVAVIGIALALPAGLSVLVNNARDVGASWESAVDFSVFLQPGVALPRAEAIAAGMRAMSGVLAVELISAEQALVEFREYSGFGAALATLGENPLPHTLVVRPAASLPAEQVADLAAQLAALEEVELVQLDTAWVERFLGILEIGRRATDITLLLLGLAVVIIVGNTIRLDIQSRRSEIEVMKLIGGSDGFIRRPFLYGGLWYGLTGGLLAVILTGSALLALSAPVARLAGMYGSDFALRGPGVEGFAILLGGGALLGWLGAWVATARHLREIEPT